VCVRNCPAVLTELSSFFEFPIEVGVRLRCSSNKLLYRIVYFMRQSCIELFTLNPTLGSFFRAKGIEFVYPIPIIRYVAQTFFAGLMLSIADRMSCTTLLDFSGVKAMISLAAATMIQKIADSNTAIVLALRLFLFYQLRCYANYASYYKLTKKIPLVITRGFK